MKDLPRKPPKRAPPKWPPAWPPPCCARPEPGVARAGQFPRPVNHTEIKLTYSGGFCPNSKKGAAPAAQAGKMGGPPRVSGKKN